jgi:cobalamin biosynthesis protein CbiG
MDGATRVVLGMGVSDQGALSDAIALADQMLAEANRHASMPVAIATLAAKAEHTLVLAVAFRLGLPVLAFDAARLEAETPRLANPSESVFRAIGCHGVAEAAALAAAGPAATLIVGKRKCGKVTMALAG